VVSFSLVFATSAGTELDLNSMIPDLVLLSAVRHMASSLALEWAKTGVRVNSLAYVPIAVFPLSDY
jgi:hypothetical protein